MVLSRNASPWGWEVKFCPAAWVLLSRLDSLALLPPRRGRRPGLAPALLYAALCQAPEGELGVEAQAPTELCHPQTGKPAGTSRSQPLLRMDGCQLGPLPGNCAPTWGLPPHLRAAQVPPSSRQPPPRGRSHMELSEVQMYPL